MSDEVGQPVLFDGYCGEPIAWLEIGQPVLGTALVDPIAYVWVSYTRVLSPVEAVQRYGPVKELVVGIQGGFEKAVYGSKTFSSRRLDPRQCEEADALLSAATVTVDDPVTALHPCPRCGAAKGVRCEGVETRHKARVQAAKARR